MEIRPLQKFCQTKGSGGGCPTVWVDDSDTENIVIQGWTVQNGDDESFVRVPRELVEWLRNASYESLFSSRDAQANC